MNSYQAIIGLEIHVQLLTESKAFCSCSSKFGMPANTQTCPVCLGLPGVLPVLNQKAFHYAIKAALALNCQITKCVVFDRKNYYYPDLPKNYQISQYALPIGKNGYLEIETQNGSKKVGIRRVHLEEDAGKLVHSQDGKLSYIDYNRSGIPLLEIVTEPELNTPAQAYDFLQELKTTLLYLGISDCNMEEGSLRCDCNVSIRKNDREELGTKTELKNMNTFRGLKQALEYEIQRQQATLESGKEVVQETRLWDPAKQATFSMRTKEEIHDYRYFPDPDLVRYEISQELIEKLKAEIPELPSQKRIRFRRLYGLSDYMLGIITRERTLADYFEEAVEHYRNPKLLANFLTSDIIGNIKELNLKFEQIKLTPQNLAKLLQMVEQGKISIKIAKAVIAEILLEEIDPEKYIQEKGLLQISDESTLEKTIREVIGRNTSAIQDYRRGKEKALTFLVGEVMKLTRGKANPALVNKLLKEKLGGPGGGE